MKEFLFSNLNWSLKKKFFITGLQNPEMGISITGD